MEANKSVVQGRDADAWRTVLENLAGPIMGSETDPGDSIYSLSWFLEMYLGPSFQLLLYNILIGIAFSLPLMYVVTSVFEILFII